ncbi:MAG: FtsX-like permease family protein, partial [Pyrinomonadaceae bacterium]|nr:FtsX-like permease family protein [Pyrinomonadaceae bacterium]
TQMPARAMELVVRAKNDPQALARSFREAVWAIDRDLPIPKIQTMDDIFAGAIAEQRLNTTLLGMFAGVALLLAAVGIYGVMSYATSQRKHEMGIRIALGASRKDILRLIVGQGMFLALTGVAAGVVASLLLARVMQTLLFGISTTDLVTFVTTPVILIFVALVACYLPARRATRVDPISTLRYE